MQKHYKLSLFMTTILLLALLVVPGFGQAGAEIGVFADREIPIGGRVEVAVEVRGVIDLYAVDVELRFDPSILTVEDADTNKVGVQPGLGMMLDAGMTLYNEVDNETGLVRFVMSQINPSEPKSGDGILLVLYFEGKQAGTSQIEVQKAEFSTRFGEAIAVSGVDAEIIVSANAPEVVATAIPVQDQAQIIVIETLAPTATFTPEATATPAATAMPATNVPTAVVAGQDSLEEGSMAEAADPYEGEQAEEKGKGSYWWFLALPVLIIIALLVYVRRGKVNQETKKSKGE
jgi:hypothetical protein